MSKKIYRLIHTGILYRYPRAESASDTVEKNEAISHFLKRDNVRQFVDKSDDEEFYVYADRMADCMMVSLLRKAEQGGLK